MLYSIWMQYIIAVVVGVWKEHNKQSIERLCLCLKDHTTQNYIYG